MYSITRNNAESMLKKIWPEISIKSIKKFSRGHTITPNYNIITNNPKLNVVLRIKKGPQYLNREKKVYTLLKNEKIPIPKIYYTDITGNFRGLYYSIVEKANGVHLDEAIRKMNRTEIIRIAQDLGNAIGKVHSVRSDNYGQITRYKSDYGRYNSFNEQYTKRVNGVINDATSAELPKDLIRKFEEYVNDNMQITKFRKKASLIHYDFYSDNIIVDTDKKRISGIVDWEQARWSDNELDLIKTIWWIFPLSKYIKNPFFESYQKHMKLSVNFESKIKFYEVVEAMAYLAWGKLTGQKKLVDEFYPLIKRRLS